MRTFGVEEELLLVDLDTGVPVALANLVTRPDSGDNPVGDPRNRSRPSGQRRRGRGCPDPPVRDGAARTP